MRPLKEDKLRAIYEAVQRHRSIAAAARELNCPARTIGDNYKHATIRLSLPDVLDPEPFVVHTPPSPDRPLPELLKARRAESKRTVAHKLAKDLINVDIKVAGPVGLAFVGDPHIDSPDCDFNSLEQDLTLLGRHSSCVFAANMGDITDNWIGRLSRLFANRTINSRETWRLAEHMFVGYGVSWLYLVGGNHDVWSGANDPLDWITSQAGIHYQPHGVRIALRFPGAAPVRVNSRHDFPGNSQYNNLHGMQREVAFGRRDHILVAAHRHTGGHALDVNPDGIPYLKIRVSGYKQPDDYAEKLNLRPKPLHRTALVIIDPTKPEKDPARLFCAPTLEHGVDYLTWLRSKL